MPLQNRVDPFGDLLAVAARVLFFGNRGGRFHTDARTLTTRRWASRQWICCVLDFKARHRDVWGRFYTELFFLDEPTAFAARWQTAFRLEARPHADAMDAVLHQERLHGRAKRPHRRNVDALPDGAFIATEEGAFAVRGKSLLHWTPDAYDACRPKSRGTMVDVLTSPVILAILSA